MNGRKANTRDGWHALRNEGRGGSANHSAIQALRCAAGCAPPTRSAACILIAALATSALALGGCGRPDPAKRPERPGEVRDFGLLYGRHCAGCHGADGKLGPAPPLNDPLFLAIATDDDLSRVVTAGRKGTLMPAFAREHGGPLTPPQVQAMVAGLREKWAGAMDAESQRLPAYSLSAAQSGGAAPPNAQAGGKVFAKVCAECHGPDGRGGGGRSDHRAGPLNDPAFLLLVSDQLLRRITITGRPDLGMHDYREISAAGPLSSQDIADVVAYVAAWRDASGRSPVAAQQYPERTTQSASP